MGELGTVLGLAKSSITGLVDRSERSGLVRREPDPRDSRAVRVALTPHGSTIADGFYGDGRRHIEDLPASLTEAERNTLADLLSRMVNDHRVSAIFMELDEPAA
jgi:DNA-binding MarR family transcriptional regulator